MGKINSVKCSRCGYTAETKSGGGMYLCQKTYELERSILSGEIENEEALHHLREGGQLDCVAAYLCPECKEFVTHNAVFFMKDRQACFPFEKPVCASCGCELIFIPNIRSADVKCPKCGGDLKADLLAFYD